MEVIIGQAYNATLTCVKDPYFTEIVDPNMKIQLLFSHFHVIQNPRQFVFSVPHKRSLAKCPRSSNLDRFGVKMT